MEEQIPPSQPPIPQPMDGQITPELVAQMKARARELAIQQTIAQQAAVPERPPQVVYVRRNLTVAEVLLVVLISCGIVTGVQWTWNIVTNVLPRVEIKVR